MMTCYLKRNWVGPKMTSNALELSLISDSRLHCERYDYGEARGYPVDHRLFNALDDLLPKIGAGYYRFEFSRCLKPRDSNLLDNRPGVKE
jgi:hypothetical protein